jgi:serine/threonine-protein kinase
LPSDIPKKVGRYVVDRLAGAGAMGFVYLGRDPELERPVAIKTLRDLGMDRASLDTFLERFKNEARAAARLHHPSIVQVYDVGEDPEVGPFLVFEYVRGATLKEVLRSRGPLPPEALLALADQISEALDIAHAEGIVHRDVKPDNLLTSEAGRVKLADFGVARVPNAALTREGQFLGTPCYAAPETLTDGTYGPKSDLFSFAAVLYEAASGLRAFPGDDAVAVAHKVINDEPPPPSHVARGSRVPETVDAVLSRALSKDPEERHGSASELAADLRRAYEAAGLADASDAPATRSRVTRPTPKREPRGFAFWAVLVGGLAVGVALVFAIGRQSIGDEAAVDAGVPDAGPAVVFAHGDHEEDAGVTVLVVVDSGTAHASEIDPESMSAHDREEHAKDLIDAARHHIEQSRFDEAERELGEARRFDPENPDITELEARLPSTGS